LTNPIKHPTLLGGEWVGSESDEWLEDLDPADIRQPIALLPRLSEAQVSDGLDEAVAAVNDSPYGLSAAAFTNDLQVAMRFAREVDTGQVAINRPTSGWDVHLPFGGFKESGSMSKEQGTEGLGFYTRVKAVAIGYTG
jgi:acyl-CoA reductase-like NAD-dependent aldehyde dehydrogenase